ncbi:MAG TPA: M56 family metallopeptidase [Longimicrobium sp.]|nr:M56 family metallopeptidase [Longimicrobium sp.]
MALSAAPLTPALAQAALIVAKSTLLLGAAALGAHALRRSSAAARHMVWSLALAGLMALPALAFLLPSWKPAALAVLRPAVDVGAAVTSEVTAAASGPQLSLETVLLAVWAAGALVVLARLVRGLFAVRRLARTAEMVDDPAWTDLLERLGRAVGVRRPVVLLRSADAAMPLTWGAFRPVVLLPAGADAWGPERRRVVLLHELAHVARRDCLMQTLAEACCAVWWFHPGAWWAARQMRVEREQACDDRVLEAGARASDYAGHLLDVARTYRAPTLAAAIAMASPSHLEGRLRAVLAAERDRRGVTRRTAAVCAGAVLLAALPLAVVTPSERAATREVAWEMPPARAERPGIHGRMTVERPTPVAAAPVAAQPAAVDQERKAKPHHAAPARLAQRSVKLDRPRARRDRRRVEARHAGLVASLDEDGNLRARVRLPEGANVRVEGHGVRTVGNELRVDLNVRRAISMLNEAAAQAEKCPKSNRGQQAGQPRKMASDIQRELSDEKRDTAMGILAGLNAAVQGIATLPAKTPPPPGTREGA